MNSNPIGVFDSGVGGLSVLQELRQLLPYEDFIYFADSAYCPYGGKSPEVIRQRALAISKFLVYKGVKLIVVASNTTSASGLEALRDTLNIPVIGVEPAVKPAVALTKQGKVGVLATGVTLASTRFSTLLDRFCDGIEVITQPCPGLVEVVEAGDLDAARPLLNKYVLPLLDQGITTIVLGCTHYPFLRSLVKDLAGEGVLVIDSGEAVAKHTLSVLEQNQICKNDDIHGREYFFTSGEIEDAGRVMGLLLKQSQLVVERVNI
ncbi:MAG TPA: glutamate racemase [Candidatus Deferrimicrobium sp.]|nr:glutamate racemase [Candidatus Deferrimicrobium sp.]